MYLFKFNIVVYICLQHLLFSVTEQQYRVKPAAVSDVSIFLNRIIEMCSFLVYNESFVIDSSWWVDNVGRGHEQT